MTRKNRPRSPYDRLTPFDEKTGDLNVVIDTPKGSRNKFEYDKELGLFRLGSYLAGFCCTLVTL